MENTIFPRVKVSHIVAVLFLFICTQAFSQENYGYTKIHMSIELLGTTTEGIGFNYEKSFSSFIDLGIGTIIFPVFGPLELHSYVRWNLFRFPITPFVCFSASYLVSSNMNYVYIPLLIRLHAGVKWQTPFYLFIGGGLTYQVFGDEHFRPQIIADTFNPGLFLGLTF